MLTLLRALALAALVVPMQACQLIGVMAANAERGGTHKVEARTQALAGKSFAVIVHADRALQGEHPLLLDFLTQKITEKLAQPENNPRAAGYIPPSDVLRFVYDNPAWALKPKPELAAALGDVQRLVILEIYEYQLHDPGNRYIWNGVASGTVSIFDPTSEAPEIAIAEVPVAAKFPDTSGQGPDQIDRRVVNTALATRFAERAAWLCYDHEEPNDAR
jgi:hypothetical protein